MTDETPKVTAGFIEVCLTAHAVRHNTYIFLKTVALLTCTTEAFWEELRISGEGPQHFRYRGHDWFLLADVQDWLVANVCCKKEVPNG